MGSLVDLLPNAVGLMHCGASYHFCFHWPMDLLLPFFHLPFFPISCPPSSPQVPFVWRESPGGFQPAERCLHPHGLPGEDFEKGGGWLGVGPSPLGSPLPLAKPQHPPDPHPMGGVLQPHQPAGQCACYWVWGIHCWWAFHFTENF